MKPISILAVLIFARLAAAGCGSQATPTPAESNPASAFCAEHGGRMVFRAVTEAPQGCYAPEGMACDVVIDRPAGSETVLGLCLLADSTECERRAYYRDECAPGTPKP